MAKAKKSPKKPVVHKDEKVAVQDPNLAKYAEVKPPFLTTTEAIVAAVDPDGDIDGEVVQALDLAPQDHDEAVTESGLYPMQGVVEFKTVVKEFPDHPVEQVPYLTQAEANAAATGQDPPDEAENLEASGIELPRDDIRKGLVHPVGKVYDQDEVDKPPFLTDQEAMVAALDRDVTIPREQALRNANLAS